MGRRAPVLGVGVALIEAQNAIGLLAAHVMDVHPSSSEASGGGGNRTARAGRQRRKK
jgi:hypothetical protein